MSLHKKWQTSTKLRERGVVERWGGGQAAMNEHVFLKPPTEEIEEYGHRVCGSRSE